MNQRILITGSAGLVGSAIAARLDANGTDISLFDIAGHGSVHGDVRDLEQVRRAVDRCDGIVHLAAISRVIWGEERPKRCRATNIGGIRNVLAEAVASKRKPWVIFASSREVYGQPDELPANEDCLLRPVNVYGRTKVAGEQLILDARLAGIRACTIRLSNVFGSITDHRDRVVPAFAHAAAFGHELRVDGAGHTFDFTHIEDVSRGIATLTELIATGQAAPPPIHFVSGIPTTLGELANLAVEIGKSGSTIRPAPPRDFDVARFVGDPSRAKELLGWQPQVPLETGLTKLIHAFRDAHEIVETKQVAR